MNVDVWHWKDPDPQSVQIVRLNQERRFTYPAVFSVATRKLTRLGDSDIRAVQVAPNGRWAVGRFDTPYRLEVSWGGSKADLYRIATETGERTLDSMHLAIRSEPHRYRTTSAPSKAHRNTRMEPMISDQKAFGDALTVLTPEQRTRALSRFNDPDYRLPPELRQEKAASNQQGEPLDHHAPGARPAEEYSAAPPRPWRPARSWNWRWRTSRWVLSVRL